MKKKKVRAMDQFTVAEIVARAQLPREMIPLWEKHRIEAFDMAQSVYDDRKIGLNVDHPPYEEFVYGPIGIAGELYKRVRRMTALLSPMRTEPLRGDDLNRLLDTCIDGMNYSSWLYALLILATGYMGNKNSDDAPKYLELTELNNMDEPPIIYNKDGSIRKPKGPKKGFKRTKVKSNDTPSK